MPNVINNTLIDTPECLSVGGSYGHVGEVECCVKTN